MSVLCCWVPDFFYQLACRADPTLAAKPVALLGADDTVWARSPLAAVSGVQCAMRPRQAQLRCPDLLLRPLDSVTAQATQQALLAVLTAWELPVELCDWGRAYLDLHTVATHRAEVQALAQGLGQQLRAELGVALQPALGWDSGKFTARAAATRTRPGHLRLVAAATESAFLAPLPLTLLPLAPAALQQLHWLGIRTLGQFAALPTEAVWQRFGKVGKLAQQWARGKDHRPVQPTAHAADPPIAIPFDPPTALLPPVLEAIRQALRPHLTRLAAGLAGCRRLHLTLHFSDQRDRPLDLQPLAPLYQEERLLTLVRHALETLNWPAALAAVTLRLEIGELPFQQLALFDEVTTAASALERITQRLVARHGPIFLQGSVVDGQHPLAERRSTFQPLP